MEVVWNLSHLYDSRDEWKKDTLKLEKLIKDLSGLDILESQVSLNSFFRQLNDCYDLVEKVYLYPKRILDLDNTDDDAKEMNKFSIELYNAYLKE